MGQAGATRALQCFRGWVPTNHWGTLRGWRESICPAWSQPKPYLNPLTPSTPRHRQVTTQEGPGGESQERFGQKLPPSAGRPGWVPGSRGLRSWHPGNRHCAELEGTGRPLLGGLSISPQGLRWNGGNQRREGRAVLCLFFVFLFQGLQNQNPV